MKKIFLFVAALMLSVAFNACGAKSAENNSESKAEQSNLTPEEAAKAARKAEKEFRKKGYALKVKQGDATYIFTLKDRSKRLDYFGPDGRHEVSIETRVQTETGGKEYAGFGYERGQWEEGYAPRQRVNNFQMSQLNDLTKFFVEMGYKQTGTTTICGKKCTVFAGTMPERLRLAAPQRITDAGVSGEIAVWDNKFMMRVIANGEVISEVVEMVFDVPETAFEQSLEVTWIK